MALTESLIAEYADVFRDELPGLPPSRDSDVTLPPPTREPNRKMMYRRVHLSRSEEAFLDEYVSKLLS